MDLARLERAFFLTAVVLKKVIVSIDCSNGVTSAVRLSGYDTHQAKGRNPDAHRKGSRIFEEARATA